MAAVYQPIPAEKLTVESKPLYVPALDEVTKGVYNYKDRYHTLL